MARPGRRVLTAAVGAALVWGVLAIGGPTAHATTTGTIATVAGGWVDWGPSSATGTSLIPTGMATAGGNVYIADDTASVVRKVDATGSQVVVAGNGTFGYSGDGGSATDAQLYNPNGVALDSSGDLFIADWGNYAVRVVASSDGTIFGQSVTAGDIYTVAGTGHYGYTGDGHPATAAALGYPAGIAVDSVGNVFIADPSNNVVRVVAASSGTLFGRSVIAGDIYTVAGDGTLGYGGDGGSATVAQLNYPLEVAVDTSGDLFIADSDNSVVRVVAAASGTLFGQSMTAGDIYTVAGNGTYGYSGDGGAAATAELADPQGVATDSVGNVFIADTDNNVVRVVARNSGTLFGASVTSGDIYTMAGDGNYGYSGDGGAATSAELAGPLWLAVDSSGNVYVGTQGLGSQNNFVRVVAASDGTLFGQSVTAGDIYTVAGNGFQQYSGDGGPATNALLNLPSGAAVDPSGDVFIGDMSNNVVRVVAGTDGTIFGQSVTAGHIYTIAGDGTSAFGGDGLSATTAELADPMGVALDSSGDLFIADSQNNRVRVVAAADGTIFGQSVTAGDIYTVAGNGGIYYSGDGGPATDASVWVPEAVAIDSSGNLFIADTVNSAVRVVAAADGTIFGQSVTAGDIYTVAGTGNFGYNGDGRSATTAQLGDPAGVAFDPSGDLFIADTANSRVRVVAASDGTVFGQSVTAGDIYTVAGTGLAGFGGDGGLATTSPLAWPDGVGLDSSGNLFIADSGNNRVRVVAASDGTWNGQSVTTGHIYLAAGDGTSGYGGDGGPATAAQLLSPSAVALDSSGDLFIADSGNHRVREVSGITPATRPSAPAMHTPTAGVGSITLSWTAGDDGGSAITGYNVYEAMNPGEENYYDAPVDSVDANATGDTISGLSGGTTYYFTVTAVNADGPGAPSDEVSATTPAVPVAPTMHTPTPGVGSITLSWTAGDDGGSAITGFNVYEATSSHGENYTTPVDQVGASATGDTIHGLSDGTTYWFTVKAVNAVGASTASSEVSTIAGKPSAPTGLTVTVSKGKNATITLSWTDHGAQISTHEVLVYQYTAGTKKHPAPIRTQVQDLTSMSGTSTPVSGLSTKSTYEFQVRATNPAGTGPWSDYSSPFKG